MVSIFHYTLFYISEIITKGCPYCERTQTGILIIIFIYLFLLFDNQKELRYGLQCQSLNEIFDITSYGHTGGSK